MIWSVLGALVQSFIVLTAGAQVPGTGQITASLGKPVANPHAVDRALADRNKDLLQ